MRSKWCRAFWFINCITLVIVFLAPGIVAQSGATVPRSVTTDDAIEMTRLADPTYEKGNFENGEPAQFSPDRSKFIVVLRKGDLQKNVNIFSIYLFHSAEVLRSPHPELLLQMRSSSNRDAIGTARWLADNNTIVFLGENEDEVSQVYAIDVATRRLKRLTDSPVPIDSYAVSGNGATVAYFSRPRLAPNEDLKPQRHEAVSITDQDLPALLRGNLRHDVHRSELFVQNGGKAPLPIPTSFAMDNRTFWISPNGRYLVAVSEVLAKDLPTEWKQYTYVKYDELAHSEFRIKDELATTVFVRYFLIDLQLGTTTLLWDGPTFEKRLATWAEDSKSIFIQDTHLPVNGIDGAERAERLQRRLYTVRINLADRSWSKAGESELPKTHDSAAETIKVTLDEDLNRPPKLYAEDPISKGRVLLLDLNPQLANIRLGQVELVTWSADGEKVTGGLYLPADYIPGKRYPLVIQTHGFIPHRFSIDGLNDWSSAFAARQLAAQGILVLQESDEDPSYFSHIGDNKSLGSNPSEADRTFHVDLDNAAIGCLDEKGLIDRDRVGITGFSRTVWYTAYALTHSIGKYRAALLADGIDGGYFQHLAFRDSEFDEDNGGMMPFGSAGLALWMKESPGFNLDKVNTPIRLMALSAGPIEQWEWFSGLSLLHKPVEYVMIPGASHLLRKPWDREVAMDGMVDWFRFWLQDYEDPGPEKKDQYRRWEHLRDLNSQQH